MTRRKILVLVAAATGLAVALAVYLHGRPAGEAAEQEAPESEATRALGSTVDPLQARAPGPRGSAPVLDRKRADEMRERLRELFAEAGPGWRAGEPDPVAAQPKTGFPEMPAPTGNQAQGAQGQYIRSVIREQFFPLARQCYESARVKRPDLAGKIELEFRIVGDKRVGGVVDQASLGDAGDLRDDAFSQCMTESMMSVSFDAPPGGGEVTVKYPIIFSPDEPDGARD